MPEPIEYGEDAEGEQLGFEIGLDQIILGSFKEGKLLTNIDFEQDEVDTIHYRIKHLRALMDDVYKLYSAGYKGKKKPTKEQFFKVFQKHSKKKEDDIHDFLEQLDREEQVFRVDTKEVDEEGNITIKLRKVSQADKLKIVKSITEKLLKKLTKKQYQSLVEEMIRRENDTEKLKRIDKKLDDEDIEVEGKKGCFKLVVGGEDLHLVP